MSNMHHRRCLPACTCLPCMPAALCVCCSCDPPFSRQLRTAAAGLAELQPGCCACDRPVQKLASTADLQWKRRADYPFGTIVDFAVDGAGVPIFCLSPLAIHARNIIEDPRCPRSRSFLEAAGSRCCRAALVCAGAASCKAGSVLAGQQSSLHSQTRPAGLHWCRSLAQAPAAQVLDGGADAGLVGPRQRAHHHLRRRVPAAAGDAEHRARRAPCCAHAVQRQ